MRVYECAFVRAYVCVFMRVFTSRPYVYKSPVCYAASVECVALSILAESADGGQIVIDCASNNDIESHYFTRSPACRLVNTAQLR